MRVKDNYYFYDCSLFSIISSDTHELLHVCIVTLAAGFHSSDNNVYSHIDSSHWLRYVCSSLRVSKEAARKIRKGSCSVIIKGESIAYIDCF